ncbi:MAG: AbrB/MazE/SpoVT family DNA-binding domain-containing protein [Candidatus Eremiobacteraeota bacterium]|nr:AbrB/MazE/SpoVT family DNA-binding domain-containing protein [Candidatus Eremiobacteraeota bacterium]
MGETVKVSMKYQVTIPEEVRKKIPLEIGSRVKVFARDDEIVIKPVVEVPREQAWFWEASWLEKEKSATEDEKAGRTKSFDDVEEALRWLKS